MVGQPVLFATLGFTPEPILAPLVSGGYTAVHVFFGPPGHPDGEVAIRRVRAGCEAFGVKLVEHPVDDPYDYTAFMRAFTEALRDVAPNTARFNVSGGTRVMVMAATVFCFSQGLPLLYHREDAPQIGRQIPLAAYRSLSNLSSPTRQVLELVQRKGPLAMGDIASDLDMAASTALWHVNRLARDGSVMVKRVGRERRVSIIPDLAFADLSVVPPTSVHVPVRTVLLSRRN